MGTFTSPMLVYFFSGQKIPGYAKDGLALAAKNFQGQIMVLVDNPRIQLGSRFIVENYMDWFDAQGFQTFVRKTPLDPGFRDGFWHKAVLRFFVIEQFMKVKGVNRLLHMELDNALLGISEIPDALDQIGKGVFLPWLTPSHGIASFVYVNSTSSLTKLIRGFNKNAHLGHEMAMLGRALQVGQGVFGLPTTGTLAMMERKALLPANQIQPSSKLGIFDAAPIGHWLFGQDARNQRGQLVRNHFIYDYYERSKEDLLSLAPKLVFDSTGLTFSSKSGTFPVRCVHIHSKALYLVRNPFMFRWVVTRSHKLKPTILPIFPRIGSWRDSRLRRKFHIFLVRSRNFLNPGS